MAIFNSYVKLPEGTQISDIEGTKWTKELELFVSSSGTNYCWEHISDHLDLLMMNLYFPNWNPLLGESIGNTFYSFWVP